MLDHITLRMHDLDGTRAFFEKVLDLTPGYRPDFPFPGTWLYAKDKPVVHLIRASGGSVDRRGETIDHVASAYLLFHDGIARARRAPSLRPHSHRHPARAGFTRGRS